MDKNIKNSDTAILVIATKNYRPLAQSLIDSLDQFVSNGCDVFIFSDEDEFTSSRHDIFFKSIQHEEWPLVTLNRFKYFSEVTNELSSYKHIVYMDCDLEVVEQTTLPPEEGSPLFGVMHPARFLRYNFWDVETNPKSTACLPEVNFAGLVYHQGCLWGGESSEVIKLINTLKNNVNIDLENNIIAKWHDESHLNKYLFDHSSIVKTLPSSYSYPENWSLPLEKIIIHKDKSLTDFPRFPYKK
jgi:hypothetical protein